MRRSRRWLAALAALIVLAGCSRKHEWVEYPIGYMGPARHNHYLAAGMLLEDYYHYDVERTSTLAQFPDPGTTLIVPAHSVSSQGGAARYRRWIERGGHLVYLTTTTRKEAWDDSATLTNDFEFVVEFGEPDEHPLLDEFGIGRTTEEDEGIKTVRFHGDRLKVRMKMDGNEILDAGQSPRRPDIVMGDVDAAYLLSFRVRRGRLTVLANDRPLRNRYLKENDHGRFVVELIQLHNPHTVRFIYGKGTSFLGMLISQAWMPLLGLAILTILWIWKNLPRFGPVIPQTDGSSRQFTEHIEMSGRFLWRHKASAELLEPLANSVVQTFYKKHPHLAHSQGAHLEYFKENTDLSEQEIYEALQVKPVNEPATMTRIVRNLKHLEESL